MRLRHAEADVHEVLTAPLAISGRELDVSRPQEESMQPRHVEADVHEI